MKKIFFCDVNQLKKGNYVVKFIDEIKDEVIAFFDNGINDLKLFSSICPHFGGEIFYDHSVRLLKCKWHGWKFCPKTGKCLSFPIKGSLSPYSFEVEPNNLYKYKSLLDGGKIYLIVNE